MNRPIFYADIDVIEVVVSKTWNASDILPEDAILAAVLGIANDSSNDGSALCDIANATSRFIRKTWKNFRPKHDFAGYAIIDLGYGEPHIIQAFAEPSVSEDEFECFRVQVFLRSVSDTALKKLLQNVATNEVRDILKTHGFLVKTLRIHEEKAMSTRPE